MQGPFIVGASFASEDIAIRLRNRDGFNIMDVMSKNPPAKGDTLYKMYQTHGEDWVAWQDVWLEDLRGLRDREVVIVAESETFKDKSQRATPDDENQTNCFDARYELPEGERASCILDWERRQVAMCATQNALQIVYVKKSIYVEKVGNPAWYKWILHATWCQP